MTTTFTLDEIDRKLLRALDADPRLPTAVLADSLGYARRTVQVRLARMIERGIYRPHSTRVDPAVIGYEQAAYVSAEVEQASLREAVAALTLIPEVLHVAGVAGQWDLMCEVVAKNPDDLFDVGQRILSCPGIRRTTTSLVLRDLIPYRTAGLIWPSDS